VAEAFVQVTEDGSGKKLHHYDRVIGANTVLDGVVILGEQYLPTYVCATRGSVSSTATIDSHLIQIMAGPSLRVRIRRIEMYIGTLATTGALMPVELRRLTTAGTGGVGHGLNALDPADPAAGATAMTIPTAKGTEGVLIENAHPFMQQTIGASTPLPQSILVWDFDRPRAKPLIIAAGVTNGICVKNAAAVAAGTVFFTVTLDESF
jgi:hypothetical protein